MTHGMLGVLERVLLIAGLMLVGGTIHGQLDAHWFQHREARRFVVEHTERVLMRTLSPAGLEASPLVPNASPGVLGRLEIPRLRLATMVVQGTDKRSLQRAVGHLPTSAPLGGAGNCALAGHRDTHFRLLEQIRTGDIARVSTLDGTFEYEVEWARVVEPGRVDLVQPTSGSVLTLVTCHPFTAIGPSEMRFVVRARRVGSVVS